MIDQPLAALGVNKRRGRIEWLRALHASIGSVSVSKLITRLESAQCVRCSISTMLTICYCITPRGYYVSHILFMAKSAISQFELF